jgi:beta-galactosidase
MKKLLILIMLNIITVKFGLSQSKIDFTSDENAVWQDQHVWQINKEALHAHFIPFPSAEAISDDIFSSSMLKSLNGTWKFQLETKPADRSKVFFREDFDDSGWDDIAFPSNWEV